MAKKINRRHFLKKTALASSGLTLLSLEEKILLAAEKEKNKATHAKKQDSAKALPMGKIGNLNISRLICGGNLISGHAHSRDLIYVSELLKNYFTDEKVMETFELCEENGVNTAILRLDDHCIRIINKYHKERGGKLQWIAQVKPWQVSQMATDTKRAIDNGAVGVYLQGGIADRWVIEKKSVDLIADAVELVKKNGVIAGVGAHSIQVPIAVEKAGIKPDFYMKTLHSGNYWSAKRPGQNKTVVRNSADNYWSATPQQTIEFMKKVKQPWMAFKVLAAGAIHPKKGFKFAYENGADFIVAGMFDFQVTVDVYIAKKILAGKLNRTRPWKG